ncbi:protein ALP1-like [Folsomia candida]|uniref:protein ALP1-like n=1 Tax=Folsomia candida TaxID=158441 RepID=UPI000B901339|nr:protein ALP1-like [Folsomia candida]
MPAPDRRLITKILILRRLRRKLKRKVRAASIRPMFWNRVDQGDIILMKELREDPHYHHRYFRMNMENFDEILMLITGEITGKMTHSRPISVEEKLGITLRFLATGASQISLSFSYRISPSAVSKILREVLQAIVKIFGHIHLPPPTTDQWITNEIGFRTRWNFPNCVGAVDGKHCRIQAPNFSGSTYHNYKGFFSIVLMAVVDHKYKFSAVDIGASGSQSDGGVFGRSEIGKRHENGKLGLPEPKIVGPHLQPHVIVADDAFALKPYMMKPFPGKFLTLERRIYNYRLSRARNVSENAFGMLAARWRIFHTPIVASLDLTRLVIHAAVILHNLLIDKQDMNTITADSDDGNTTGNWRETTTGDTGMISLRQQGSNNRRLEAVLVRDRFLEYFNSNEGSVSWQMSRIS